MQLRKTLFVAGISSLATILAGCAKDGELDSTGGITVTRSSCPAVAIPAYTGDVTQFNPPASRDSRAIDVVANITDLRSTCSEQGEDVVSSVTFKINARRIDPRGARDVPIAYFATVVQGGRAVVSKRISQTVVHFDDGQLRGSGAGSATTAINRASATLPAAIQEKITRRRKAGDADAAVDPFTDPEVKAAVARAGFEFLIGFQLTQEQLQYNATR